MLKNCKVIPRDGPRPYIPTRLEGGEPGVLKVYKFEPHFVCPQTRADHRQGRSQKMVRIRSAGGWSPENVVFYIIHCPLQS